MIQPTGRLTQVPRDPSNELYDRACDLLDAAQRLSRALDLPGTEPALAATLGCVQAALHELTGAFGSLPHIASPGPRSGAARTALVELAEALDHAERRCDSARHQRSLQSI